MFPYIVADIGGTNARFALVTDKAGDQFNIEHIQILKGAEYASFEDAMQAYVDGLNGIKATAACVAIAAPIGGDLITMTNLPWSFSQEAVRQRFDLTAFCAINDYTALAVATSRLDESGLVSVIAGERKPTENKAILGPGTGLGVAGLAYAGKHWLPISSEGGHVNMAPANDFESDVLGRLRKQHSYVSAETCLSGPGIINLYKAVAELKGQSVDALAAHEISARGVAGDDALCTDVMNLFCGFLGSVSSNLVLTYGGLGGVYITGGIIPRFIDFVKQSPFEQNFRNKGVMSHYVEHVPVDVVTYDQPAFLGAAAWLDQTLAAD